MHLEVTQRGQRTQHQLAGFHKGQLVLQGHLHADQARLHLGKFKLKGQLQPTQPPECPIPERTDSGEPYWSFTPNRNLKLSHRITIAEHVMRHSAMPPRPLLKQGFATPHVRQFIQYDIAKTPAEIQSALELRTKSYKEANKHTSNAIMTDRYDNTALIIIGKHQNKVVATLRVMLHQDHEQWEHEQFITWSATLPPKETSLEITRVAVDPEYRGTDTAFGLMEHAAYTVVDQGKRYLIGSATNSLLPIYQQIGCVPSDIQFTYETLNSKPHTIFYGDLNMVTHIRFNPLLWCHLWFPTWAKLKQKNALPTLTPQSKAKLALYQAMRPPIQATLNLLNTRKLKNTLKKQGAAL